MGKNAEYVAKMETQLKKWDAEVDALAADGKKATAKARAAYDEQVKHLRASRDAAQKTFHGIRAAGESAVATLQADMEAAWQAMQKNLKQATSDLRK